MDDTGFAWYSKFRGGNSVLKFTFRLKYDKGFVFNSYLTPLEMNADRVYADLSTTPFMTLYTMKEKKPSREIKTTLYHLVDSYCIISLILYIIMIGIIFVFVWFLFTVLCS